MKQPLAFRMRPQHLDDIIGQQHLIGEGKVLRRCVLEKRLFSMIFYGPPGTGKTTLAMSRVAIIHRLVYLYRSGN